VRSRTRNANAFGNDPAVDLEEHGLDYLRQQVYLRQLQRQLEAPT
jgi:hypothetical protein